MFLPHTALHAAAAGVSISPQMSIVADHVSSNHLLTWTDLAQCYFLTAEVWS